jgi:hypothetical protein
MKKIICKVFGHNWWLIGCGGLTCEICKRCGAERNDTFEKWIEDDP